MHDPDMGTWAYTYNPDGLAQENRFTQGKGFTFQLSDADRRQAKDASGPLNAQALNRYSYVLNNPVRYIDPTGHAENGSGVRNASSRPVIIRGEKEHIEKYRRPGCDPAAQKDATTCYYWEEVLLPGYSSTDLGFREVDSVCALGEDILVAGGDASSGENKFKLFGYAFVVITDGPWDGTVILSLDWFCLLPGCG